MRRGKRSSIRAARVGPATKWGPEKNAARIGRNRMLTGRAKLSGAMASKWRDIWSRFSGRGIYPYQLCAERVQPGV